MKYFSILLMALVMVLASSCSKKESETTKDEPKTAASIAKSCEKAVQRLNDDSSEINILHAVDTFLDAVDFMKDNKDDDKDIEKVTPAVAELFNAIDFYCQDLNDETRQKIQNKLKPYSEDKEALDVIMIITSVAGQSEFVAPEPDSDEDYDSEPGEEYYIGD